MNWPLNAGAKFAIYTTNKRPHTSLCCKKSGLNNLFKGLRFSKSSQRMRKDLLSHLNLYNPMNISLGGNSFITTFHDTKIQCSDFVTNDIFRGL